MNAQRNAIYSVVEACLDGAKRAEIFISKNLSVRAARRHKPDKRSSITEILVTIGKPNYAGREFVKLCKKAGEPFPVKKIQMKFYKDGKKR